MQNIPIDAYINDIMDELKVTWDDNTSKLIHKKCQCTKSGHNDIKYHMT